MQLSHALTVFALFGIVPLCAAHAVHAAEAPDAPPAATATTTPAPPSPIELPPPSLPSSSAPSASALRGAQAATPAPTIANPLSADPQAVPGARSARATPQEPKELQAPALDVAATASPSSVPASTPPEVTAAPAVLSAAPPAALPAVTDAPTPASTDPTAALPEQPTTPAAPAFAQEAPKFATVWERIRVGFKMTDMNDPLVRKWENFYAVRPEYWQRINDRGRRYLYFITAEIERRGMPLEIALLPIIESAYNPEAFSRARASGIWQFIPATGKLYGLQQNWWLDNRRDVSAATASALDYLQKLHDMFGDWQLALASYNWGEGAVQRAINRNKAHRLPTDYASLKIPTETRNYLPKLQAVKNLIIAPERYGLSLPDVPDAPYFTTVTTERQIDVALAARLADMPLEDFRILNPAHNRPVMAGVGEQRINLPFDKAETFVMNLDSYTLPLVSWRPYQMKMGEKLEHVAERFGMNLVELKRVNGLSGKRKIAPGHTLLVPGAGADQAASPIQTTLFKEAPRDGPGWHRVKRGETLNGIANRYELQPADLRKLNGLNGSTVAPGSRLRLQEGTALPSSGKSKAGKRAKKKVTATRRR